MREEHPNQHELPNMPTGSVVEKAAELSEVAALSAKVIDHGLVREHRPVFVFDAKLAKQKSGNAERQARFREKRASEGLVMTQIPSEIAEKLKELGGDWSKLAQIQIKEVRVEVIKTVEVIKEVRVEVPVEKIKEIRVEVPGKPTLKLTSEQKKTYFLGQKVQALKGFKRYLAKKILGF